MVTVKEALVKFIGRKKYFSINECRENLSEKGIDFNSNTVKQYLYDLRSNREIYNAGTSWYSTLKDEFDLQTEPVERLVLSFDEKYPDLEFSVWSTEQIASFFHHLPTRFATFIYVDRDFHAPIFDYLRNDYDDHLVLKNPGKNEAADHFFIDQNPIVLRHYISQSREDNHFASIEKILVDLFMEEKKLGVVGEAEYLEIFNNIVFERRINVAKMLRYSGRRECKEEIKKLLMSEKNKN